MAAHVTPLGRSRDARGHPFGPWAERLRGGEAAGRRGGGTRGGSLPARVPHRDRVHGAEQAPAGGAPGPEAGGSHGPGSARAAWVGAA
jgi:hypothetical protein